MEKFKLPESIRTERLILLKRTHEHDADMFQAINESRLFVREYLFWVDSQKTIADIQKATDKFIDAWETDKEWAYDIYRVEDNYFIGCVGPHNINFLNQSAEFGYWQRLSAIGNGYMTEAVLAVEKELFEFGMHRLTICCDTNNRASANVAKRAGYKLESIAKEATYHWTGLHDMEVYVKFSPYPIKGFDKK